MVLIDPAPMRQMRMLVAARVWLTLAGCAATMIALTALGSSPTGAAPNCLTQPNFRMAEGRHWHYRTDRATRRKCWFIKRTGESIGETAIKPQPTAKPIAPTPLLPMPASATLDGLSQREAFPWPRPTERTPAVMDERPVDSAQVPTLVRTSDDHAGTSGRAEPPPIAAEPAEPAKTPAAERENLALAAIVLLLIGLAAGAGLNHWRVRRGAGAGDRRADYLSVLSRAVADLDPHDGEARRAIYDRARRILLDQLRAADSGKAILRAEQAALDAAIARIEAQSADRESRPSRLREATDRSFTPRFGSGGKPPAGRRRLNELARWALRASRPA